MVCHWPVRRVARGSRRSEVVYEKAEVVAVDPEFVGWMPAIQVVLADGNRLTQMGEQDGDSQAPLGPAPLVRSVSAAGAAGANARPLPPSAGQDGTSVVRECREDPIVLARTGGMAKRRHADDVFEPRSEGRARRIGDARHAPAAIPPGASLTRHKRPFACPNKAVLALDSTLARPVPLALRRTAGNIKKNGKKGVTNAIRGGTQEKDSSVRHLKPKVSLTRLA